MAARGESSGQVGGVTDENLQRTRNTPFFKVMFKYGVPFMLRFAAANASSP